MNDRMAAFVFKEREDFMNEKSCITINCGCCVNGNTEGAQEQEVPLFTTYKTDLLSGQIDSATEIITTLTIPAGFYLLGYFGKAFNKQPISSFELSISISPDTTLGASPTIYEAEQETEILLMSQSSLPIFYNNVGIWAVKLK